MSTIIYNKWQNIKSDNLDDFISILNQKDIYSIINDLINDNIFELSQIFKPSKHENANIQITSMIFSLINQGRLKILPETFEKILIDNKGNKVNLLYSLYLVRYFNINIDFNLLLNIIESNSDKDIKEVASMTLSHVTNKFHLKLWENLLNESCDIFLLPFLIYCSKFYPNEALKFFISNKISPENINVEELVNPLRKIILENLATIKSTEQFHENLFKLPFWVKNLIRNKVLLFREFSEYSVSEFDKHAFNYYWTLESLKNNIFIVDFWNIELNQLLIGHRNLQINNSGSVKKYCDRLIEESKDFSNSKYVFCNELSKQITIHIENPVNIPDWLILVNLIEAYNPLNKLDYIDKILNYFLKNLDCLKNTNFENSLIGVLKLISQLKNPVSKIENINKVFVAILKTYFNREELYKYCLFNYAKIFHDFNLPDKVLNREFLKNDFIIEVLQNTSNLSFFEHSLFIIDKQNIQSLLRAFKNIGGQIKVTSDDSINPFLNLNDLGPIFKIAIYYNNKQHFISRNDDAVLLKLTNDKEYNKLLTSDEFFEKIYSTIKRN